MKKRQIMSLLLFFGLFMISTTVKADLEEGKKMIRYQRYQTAVDILTPLAASSDEAKYYLGLAQIANGELEVADATMNSIGEGDFKYAGLACIHFLQNKEADALSELAQLTRKVKRKDWLQYKLAGDATFFSANENVINKGVEWYNMALEKQPDPNVYVALGNLNRKLVQGGGAAMTAYQQATILDPSNSYSYAQQGKLWYDAKVFDSVLVLYNKAKEFDPENPLPYGYLADAYLQQGNFEYAKTNIEKFLELSDKTMEDRNKYLKILFLAKDYDRVIEVGNSLIGTEVEAPYMYRLIGESYINKEDYPNAKKNFNTFFEKQPKDKILYTDYQDMALISLHDGDTAKSDEYTMMAINLVSDDSTKADIMTSTAEYYKEIKDYGRAGKWYNKALPLSAGEKSDYFWAGYLDYFNSNYDNSIKTFKAMQEKYPDEPSAYYWCGRSQMAIDQSAETGLAKESFTKYLELTAESTDKDDERVRAMEYLATLAYNKKDYTLSMEYCKKILALDPEDNIAKQISGYISKM